LVHGTTRTNVSDGRERRLVSVSDTSWHLSDRHDGARPGLEHERGELEFDPESDRQPVRTVMCSRRPVRVGVISLAAAWLQSLADTSCRWRRTVPRPWQYRVTLATSVFATSS